MGMDRRSMVKGALLLFAGAAPRAAAAQDGSLYPLRADTGGQVYNYRLPSDLSAEALPGVVWAGAAHPEVILIEYFDYNCPFCRKAEGDLDALLRPRPGLRLGLVNDPLLGPGSVQAAKVQQAVLRAAGPARAYAFHRAIYAKRGPVDGPLALRVAGEMGFDAKAVEAAADLPQVAAVVARQAALARALGFDATPSFSLGTIGILGYLGPDALGKAVADMRRCDKLACG